MKHCTARAGDLGDALSPSAVAFAHFLSKNEVRCNGSPHVTVLCFVLIVLFVADLHHTPPRPVCRLTSSLLDALPLYLGQ